MLLASPRYRIEMFSLVETECIQSNKYKLTFFNKYQAKKLRRRRRKRWKRRRKKQTSVGSLSNPNNDDRLSGEIIYTTLSHKLFH
jgi:hypothetical protein